MSLIFLRPMDSVVSFSFSISPYLFLYITLSILLSEWAGQEAAIWQQLTWQPHTFHLLYKAIPHTRQLDRSFAPMSTQKVSGTL